MVNRSLKVDSAKELGGTTFEQLCISELYGRLIFKTKPRKIRLRRIQSTMRMLFFKWEKASVHLGAR